MSRCNCPEACWNAHDRHCETLRDQRIREIVREELARERDTEPRLQVATPVPEPSTGACPHCGMAACVCAFGCSPIDRIFTEAADKITALRYPSEGGSEK